MEYGSVGTLILDFWPLELGENTLLLSQAAWFWYSVVAAPESSCKHCGHRLIIEPPGHRSCHYSRPLTLDLMICLVLDMTFPRGVSTIYLSFYLQFLVASSSFIPSVNTQDLMFHYKLSSSSGPCTLGSALPSEARAPHLSLALSPQLPATFSDPKVGCSGKVPADPCETRLAKG